MAEKFKVTYTNRDLMDKLEKIHGDIEDVKLAQAVTNGKVKIHSKVLYSMSSLMILIIGWIIFYLK